MMKKQSIQIGILFVLCLAFFGAYLGLKKYNASEASKADDKADTSVELEKIDTDEITSFSYQYDGETFSYNKDGEAWYFTADPSLDLDEDKVSDMLSYIATIQADDQVEQPEALSEYGLEQPENTITIVTADQTTTIHVGAYNDVASCYYFSMDDSDAVYTIASGFATAFHKTVEELLVTETVSEDSVSSDSTEKYF